MAKSRKWRDLMEKGNLTQLVYNICSGNYCQEELIQFINLAQKISISYLKYQELLGKRISSNTPEAELELSDLALDCIAELFARDENQHFPHLKKYYLTKFSELPKISDEETLILTRRLIVRKTKQELSRIFRDRDPEGAKIVRNIKVAIRLSKDLHLFREMGKEYVYLEKNGGYFSSLKSQNNYLRRQQAPIPEEILREIFFDGYKVYDSFSASIRKLLENITSLRQYQNFVSLEMLVKLFRDIKLDSTRDWLSSADKVLTPSDHLDLKEMEEYIDIVMRNMWKRLESQYLRTNKLHSEKAVIYHKALRDVLYDLIQKRDTSSYYRNLKFYMSHLSQKQYRQQERSIFEYLAKLAKREFRKYLCEML